MKKNLIPDLDLSLLNIQPNDHVSHKLLMLIEGTYGMGVKKSIHKYNYSEQRYYQMLKSYKKEGIAGLIDQKRGPKSNRVRSERVINQIIRFRFIDPDASAAVIAQKLNQMGMKVSLRSVERTIQQYGLQKKTSPTKSRSSTKANLYHSTNQKGKKRYPG